MNPEIRKKLEECCEHKYAEFSGSLVPGAGNMLGVRIPVLRKYAKKLSKNGEDILNGDDDIYFEEKLLRGMIIGYIKTDVKSKLKLIKSFVPLIDNWSVCDSFCCTLKFPESDKSNVLDFLQPYIHSNKEFEQRFAAVMLLDLYINDEYIDKTLEALKIIDTNAYYSSMAVAWTAAECYIKYPEKTLPYIKDAAFNTPTHNRTIRKICDSYRVKKEDKLMLKKFIIK